MLFYQVYANIKLQYNNNKQGKNMNRLTDTMSDTFQDTLTVATWNRTRSLDELRAFITSHSNALLDVEDFEV